MNKTISTIRRAAMAAVAGTLYLGLALPASAQSQSDASAPNASQPSRARPAPERQICVRMHFTGSRLPQKICMTEREWEAEGGVPSGR